MRGTIVNAYALALSTLVLAACEKTTIEVVPVSVVNIQGSTSTPLVIGGTVQLSAALRSDRGETLQRDLSWSSSNTAVATVTGSGLVTAVGAGSAAITASAGQGSGTANITVNNPEPTLSALTPPSAVRGAASVTITATGANFVRASVIRVNGTDRTTTFINSTQLTAALTAADLGTVANLSVTVVNPGPGGGTSAARSFGVLSPIASVSISPTSGHQIRVGMTWNFTAQARDGAGNPVTGQAITWSSNNTAVATVDANGRVEARAAGTAVIQAATAGFTAQSTLSVTGDVCGPITTYAPGVTLTGMSLNAGSCLLFSQRVDQYAFSSATAFSMQINVTATGFNPSTTYFIASGLTLGRGLVRFIEAASATTQSTMAILPAGSYGASINNQDARFGTYDATFNFGSANPEVTNCRSPVTVAPLTYAGTLSATDCTPSATALNGSSDGFLMALRAGETITIGLNSTAFDGMIEIYDNAGNRVQFVNAFTSAAEEMTFNATTAGLFIIAAKSVTRGVLGAYTLTVRSNMAAGLLGDAGGAGRPAAVRAAPVGGSPLGAKVVRPVDTRNFGAGGRRKDR